MKKIFIFLALLSLTMSSYSQEKPYSNPILIYGTSFGNFFKTLYKLGEFDNMMKFTSSESIKKYGYDSILHYYKIMDFGYDMKLTSRTFQNKICTLNYNAVILGTNRTVRLDVVIENDTAKVLLDNILFNMGIDSATIFKRYDNNMQ